MVSDNVVVDGFSDDVTAGLVSEDFTIDVSDVVTPDEVADDVIVDEVSDKVTSEGVSDEVVTDEVTDDVTTDEVPDEGVPDDSGGSDPSGSVAEAGGTTSTASDDGEAGRQGRGVDNFATVGISWSRRTRRGTLVIRVLCLRGETVLSPPRSELEAAAALRRSSCCMHRITCFVYSSTL